MQLILIITEIIKLLSNEECGGAIMWSHIEADGGKPLSVLVQLCNNEQVTA